MRKYFQREHSSSPQQTESELAAMMKRMQQQLVFLERKIDLLLGQSGERPVESRNFSKSRRPFDAAFRPEGAGRRAGRESHFPAERSYEPPQKSEGAGAFRQRQKPFYQRRKRRG
ncbi:MAG: hypothetical protein NC924_00360 [Candidatus Omnitrophica bacterium]|nr:hypothetical protein [Candidatus Omnitrophota bacterium]